MKIQYCSDLHLEFSTNSRWLKDNPILSLGDILIVAGDTYYLGNEFAEHEWFDYASKNWEQVFLIPGNHEFYGGADASICMELDYEIYVRENVRLVNNKVIEIENIRFIFTTLWSKIEKHIGPILGGLNDFRLIQVHNQRLNLQSFNRLFEISWQFLKSEIAQKSPKSKIVVTHHLPSERCNLPIHQGSLLNEAFCVDLTDEIEASDVYAWIYGHSHGNVADFKIGNTLMLTNQLGYIEAREHKSFKRDAYFELD